eukprot:296741-Amphidinium_carterae.1
MSDCSHAVICNTDTQMHSNGDDENVWHLNHLTRRTHVSATDAVGPRVFESRLKSAASSCKLQQQVVG